MDSAESSSGTVAALVLLAASAPTRVVAADLVAVARHPLLRHDRAAASIERPGGYARAVAEHQAACRAGRRHCLGAGKRLVLVGETVAGLCRLRPLEGVGVLDLDLRVEECRDDLGADLAVQLLEHAVAFGGVLDER